MRHRAYEDAPLPIGNGQTISQPWVHARYLELLQLTGKERVLEIGTGSGYQTVLLAHLVAQVFSIERIPALFHTARENIEKAGVRNVSLLMGDGTVGWREYAPYDGILVGAGAPSVPQPLLDQLAEGGRLLIPIGDREVQKLVLAERKNGADYDDGHCARAIRTAPGFTRLEHRERRLIESCDCTSSFAAECKASDFAGSCERQRGSWTSRGG